MATPNYGYEKRQRELAKKKKKEEKLRAKASNARHGSAGDGPDAPPEDAQTAGPANDPGEVTAQPA